MLFSDSDRMFLEDFHNRKLARFGHQDHLHLAWLILKNHTLDEGLGLIGNAIREFAKDQGAANRYHETLTSFWGRIIAHAIETHLEIDDFQVFLEQFPFLLDKQLALRHWSESLLWSDQSRSNWTPPDLRPLP